MQNVGGQGGLRNLCVKLLSNPNKTRSSSGEGAGKEVGRQ